MKIFIVFDDIAIHLTPFTMVNHCNAHPFVLYWFDLMTFKDRDKPVSSTNAQQRQQTAVNICLHVFSREVK